MYNIYLNKRVLLPLGSRIRKLLLIMKITTLILITVILHVSANTMAQKVTLNKKNAQLVDVFNDINAQTGYDFAFTTTTLKDAKPVTINVRNEELSEVLTQIFQGQNLEFTIENKSVVIKPKEETLIDKARAYFAQITVTGKVQDELGQPLPGVTVRVKGTSNAFATDSKGSFSIVAPDDKAIIQFTFIGYESIELPARDVNGTTITMKASQTNLKEVVVNKGYYTTTQELNTGNVTHISGEDIAKQPGIDPIAALEGRVPGLYISQTSGIPGANETVLLRGRNSLRNGNDPLYIIDGVPVTSSSLTSGDIGGGALGYGGGGAGSNIIGSNGSATGMSPFSTLDPSNIESIEILKDADATAIYGSRGANGVILITTKRGKPGKTLVDINVLQGASRIASELDLMNTQQYLAMRYQALKNDGLTPSLDRGDYDLLLWDTNRYTDWQKVLIGRTAQYTNAVGSISGGTANTQFIIGGSYNRQTTVFPGNYVDKKGNAHFNLTHSSTDQKFHANFSAQYGYDSNIIPQADFTSFVTIAPNSPALYNPDGTLNWGVYPSVGPTFNNPITGTFQTAKSTTGNLNSHLMLSYQIFPGLVLKSSLGYTRSEMNQTNQQPATVGYGPPDPNNRLNQLATNSLNSWIFEPQINYTKQISKGNLDVLLGMTQEENQYNSVAYTAVGFSSDALISNPAFASNFYLSGANYSQYRYAAIYGRVNYNWEEKYLFNLTARRDGSSRFGPGNEFGNFGAIGAGWIFSKEKFAGNISWLSFGKIRASYGTSGNDQIGDYQFLSTYSSGGIYQGVSTLQPTAISNPYYGWEVNKKLEGGLDLGFLKDRIYLTIDYFRNRSGNQLVGLTLPNVTGFNTVVANLPAVVQNTGLELQLNTTNIKTKSFSWSSSINLTVPRNVLVSYPGLSSSIYADFYSIGKPIYTPAVYHYTGINPQTGVYTFQDVNGDGVLNNSDRQHVNGALQKYFGGFDNSFSYKGLQLSVLFQFVKQTGINYLNSFPFPGLFNQNQLVNVQKAWQNPGDIVTNQRYTSNGGTAAANAYGLFEGSDARYTDASFIRLKNIQLSYRLPASWTQKMHIQNFRVFLQGQNLLTITKYEGLDPETQSASTLPPLRTITAGLELGL